MAFISSRSIIRPYRADWSACVSRRRRITTTRSSMRLLNRWSTCGIALVCVGANRQPPQSSCGVPSILERWRLYRPFRGFTRLLLRAGAVARQQRHGQRHEEDTREVVGADVDGIET